jgi:hypothetical protein
MHTETEQAEDTDNTTAHPRRGRRIRLVVAAAALATLMLGLAPASPAGASISRTYTSMRCGGGEVNVNVPQATSTYRDNVLLTRAELYYQAANGSWYRSQDSGSPPATRMPWWYRSPI